VFPSVFFGQKEVKFRISSTKNVAIDESKMSKTTFYIVTERNEGLTSWGDGWITEKLIFIRPGAI
jgi:hypothetical protein